MSMESILTKCYQGKLEHREVDIYETLLLSRRVDPLVVSLAQVGRLLEVSSMIDDKQLLDSLPIPTVVPHLSIEPSHTVVVEESKYGMISNVQQAMVKRTAILAMESPLLMLVLPTLGGMFNKGKVSLSF